MMNSKRQNKHYEDILDKGRDLIKFYHSNPCVAAYDLLGIDFAPIQRLVFEDMWFKNYVITIASRGFGKSNDVNSLVHFDGKGLVYLHEELPPIPPHLKDGEEEIVDCDYGIYTSEGFKPTKKLCVEKGIVGKRLDAHNGFVQKGSSHHPLLILNSNCEFEYKGMQEFVPGDKVCIQRRQQVFGENDIPEDDAYLIGLLTGESSREFLTFAGDNIYYKSDDYACEFRFNKGIDYFLEEYGVDSVSSNYKSVPRSIRTATRKSQIAFLQGYFDTDGTVHNTNGGVSCCSVSKKLLNEVQLMLLNFGIVSRVRKKKTKSKFGKAYLLDMFSEDAYKFKELIGFRLKRKQEILDDYFKDKKLNINKDTIPHALQLCHSITKFYHSTYTTSKKPSFRIRTGNKKGLSYDRLHRFLVQCREVEAAGFNLTPVKEDVAKLYSILKYNYYFDTVVSVEDWKGDCYDFEMDMESGVEPNYFSNGFINHNTFLLGALATLNCMLRPGYRVGLMAPVFRQSLAVSSMNSDAYDVFWTSSGLETTAVDLYDSVVSGVTEIQSLDTQNRVLSKWKDKNKACRYIKTTKGFELSGTVDHAVLTLQDRMKLDFKDLQDIRDEYIAIKTGFNYFGNNNHLPNFDEFDLSWRTKDCLIPEELTPDLSYWMGQLVGDGCVSINKDKDKQRISFVNEDQDLLDSFESNLRKYFCVDKKEKICRRNRKNNTWEIEYYCKKLIQYLLKCGFTKTTALDKKIPVVIKRASKENLIAFTQGLIDTDGCFYVQKNGGSEITFNTSSKQLAREVQSILLNLGIVSNFGISSRAGTRQLSVGNSPSKCSEAYKVRITGQTFITRFQNVIGFRCKRKKDKLESYIRTHFFKEPSIARAIGLPNSVVKNYETKCREFYDQGLYFVKIKEHDYFFSDTIDIEVENESCYWANGFINHNSKMIFSEVEKLYSQSSILREACEKRPTRGSDTCYLKFKAVSGMTPSFIEALPLGDGNKIRGSRFYLVAADELAQIPDQTLDMVIRPMGATSLAPMERVRRLEQQQRLIALGLASEDDFEEEIVNKMIMTSSGYYKFNHMWRRMKDHWSQMDIAAAGGEESPYAVWQVPYVDLPTGFLDSNNIAEARRVMSNSEFRMEYEAEMISDSEGFFKASLIEQCTLGSGHGIELRPDKTAQYILGVDPNQGGKASTGVIIIKIGVVNRIVSVLELKRKTTQQLTQAVQELCNEFNVIRVFMDKGGGGKAICDLLEEGYGGHEPIIDRSNDDHRHLPGRHILDLVHFNPAWISDANFTTKSMLEDTKLLFPEAPISSTLDIEARYYENVNTLKSQMLNIIVTQTATGVLHFDTPTKGQNKDLYSALILAAHGAKMLEKEIEGDQEPVLYNAGGMVRPRNTPSRDFNSLHNIGGHKKDNTIMSLSSAVLHKKLK